MTLTCITRGKMKNITNSLFVTLLLLFALSSLAFSQTETDRPVRIIKNSPAPYTGEARSRMLEGWIKLRVTFLEDGKIGDIFYVDESHPERELSKYGLLKNCYEAAKKIQFEPALKDGKPVTVTKVLQYNFSLGRNPGGFTVRRP